MYSLNAVTASTSTTLTKSEHSFYAFLFISFKHSDTLQCSGVQNDLSEVLVVHSGQYLVSSNCFLKSHIVQCVRCIIKQNSKCIAYHKQVYFICAQFC
jgi:hypothetical protein